MSEKTDKPGFIYLLVHPSNQNLYKFGITTWKPEDRLAEHNSDCKRQAGKIVKETGQKWQLKEYHAVPDMGWAEEVFWASTAYSVTPYSKGVEVCEIKREEVFSALDKAKKAGLRPPPSLKPEFDNIYAYTAEMKKRLQGRGISLEGYVTDRSGKSNFICSNGHKWKARSMAIAEGAGCPFCGIGTKDLEEIWKTAKLGYIYLLKNPDMPGFIRIELSYDMNVNFKWEDNWESYRYRYVIEPVLAEKLLWEMLGKPLPHNREPIEMDLKLAENAFKNLIFKMQNVIAEAEKEKEKLQEEDAAKSSNSVI